MTIGHPIKKYLPYSLAAAITYSIIAWIYIGKSNYPDIWILYIGNALFAVVILFFAYYLYKHYINTRSISKMVIGLHLTSTLAILIACALCFIGLLVLNPHVFSASKDSAAALTNQAPQLQGKNNDLLMVLFVDAIVGNAATGFFISLIFPFSLMRNQKGNKEGENQGPGTPVDALPGTEVDSLDQPVSPKEAKK